MYQEMESNIEGSFLEKYNWTGLLDRNRQVQQSGLRLFPSSAQK
jgi:hypothetical protein